MGTKGSKQTKLVACYVRVSTVGQNEAGQRAEMERWLTGHSVDPASIRWFIDHGKTGTNLDRPAFIVRVHSSSGVSASAQRGTSCADGSG